jgi:tol-pal system protein YbgF
MHLRRAVFLKLVPAAAAAVLLSGCFATQKDLDPIRSDISVLEKQFMEVQRESARSRHATESEEPVQSEMAARISDAYTRLSAVEKRLDALEAEVGARQGSPAAPAESAAPTAPEPIMIEPIPPEKSAEPKAPQPTKGMKAAEEVYKGAMDLYDAGEYDKAEAAFGDFLAKYPKDNLADDARYHIGEIYFAKKDFTRALKEYARLLQDYPLSDRAPDALYRSGMASEELGDTAKAREFYTRATDNYPYSDAAKEARLRLDNLK